MRLPTPTLKVRSGSAAVPNNVIFEYETRILRRDSICENGVYNANIDAKSNYRKNGILGVAILLNLEDDAPEIECETFHIPGGADANPENGH